MDTYIKKINDLISKKKLDKEHLAVQIDVKRATFYNYLNGATKMPVNILINLSNSLGVPVSYFFEDGEIKNSVSEPEVYYGNNNNVIENLKLENKILKEQIEELKNIIKQKDEMIEHFFKIHK